MIWQLCIGTCEAFSVVDVAAVVPTIAAAIGAPSASTKDKHVEKTDMAIAAAATLVATQCVEVAEVTTAEREHLLVTISISDRTGFCSGVVTHWISKINF